MVPTFNVIFKVKENTAKSHSTLAIEEENSLACSREPKKRRK
jgi:hypothetical protein